MPIQIPSHRGSAIKKPNAGAALERPYRGRGPKGYRRSDERIKEDINDRLSEGYLDATEIEVAVNARFALPFLKYLSSL